MSRRGPAPTFTDELRVNVTPDQRSAVLALAAASDASLSAVVRSALDAFLQSTPHPEESWDREPTR